jgi:hypothetical protein
VSKSSTLVEILVNESADECKMNYLITIDSENLLRAWSLKDTSTIFSYKITTE